MLYIPIYWLTTIALLRCVCSISYPLPLTLFTFPSHSLGYPFTFMLSIIDIFGPIQTLLSITRTLYLSTSSPFLSLSPSYPFTHAITCIFTFSRLLHQDRLIKTPNPSPPPPPLRWTVSFTSYSAATTNPVYTALNAVTSQTRTTRISPSPSPSRDVGRAPSTSR